MNLYLHHTLHSYVNNHNKPLQSPVIIFYYFFLITGQMHKLHQKQILPSSSLPHLQPPLHARLHFAPQLPASPFRGQPRLIFAPLANVNAPPAAVHTSAILRHPSRQSPAPSPHELSLCAPISNWLPPSAPSGSTPMQGSASVTPSSTPRSREPLKMMKTKSWWEGSKLKTNTCRTPLTLSPCLCPSRRYNVAFPGCSWSLTPAESVFSNTHELWPFSRVSRKWIFSTVSTALAIKRYWSLAMYSFFKKMSSKYQNSHCVAVMESHRFSV